MNYKRIINPLFILTLAVISNNTHAQYIIEGSKYRSIRDSLLGNEKWYQQKDPVNSISITYNFIETGFYTGTDQMDWQKTNALTKTYNGQKIRHILLQHASGRAIIVLKGKDSVNISEAAAVREGLLPNSFYTVKDIIKVDSPLYVGSQIPVYIKKQDPENKLVSLQAGIKSTGIPFQYELQSYLPGDVWVMEMGADGKTKKVYAYTLLPDSTQADVAGDFYAGNIKSVIADYNLFKNQDNMNATDDYRFSGGTVYFTGPASRNVKVVTISGSSLKPAKPLLYECFPGSTVMFDNVTLLDSAGEKHATMGKSYTLIDKDDIRSNYAGLFTEAHFVGGTTALYRYVIETLIRLPAVNLTKGKFDFDFAFMLEGDGTLTDILENDFSGKDKIYKVCYDLIKYSNTWVPASYKNERIRMPLNLHFTIDVK